jgi:hypothetical protein
MCEWYLGRDPPQHRKAMNFFKQTDTAMSSSTPAKARGADIIKIHLVL